MTNTDPTDPHGAARLSHWGVIRAKGADAATFLHGQLTQDMLSVDAASARLAGYCSAKGRLLASFVVWRASEDVLLLACSADVLPAALKRLSMFVLRAKCKLSDASAEIALYGLAGAAARQTLGADTPEAAWQCRASGPVQWIRLPDAAPQVPRWLWAAPAGEAPPALPELSLAAWQWLDVASGVPSIVGATVEKFVPQMVNLELVGGVSFSKGCYPGQEVVARSQYRGTLKRRAFLFESNVAAAAGDEVFASADPLQPAGMVANAASYAGRHRALVELKIAVLGGSAGTADGQATLHLGSAEGPRLDRSALPYDVPIA